MTFSDIDYAKITLISIKAVLKFLVEMPKEEFDRTVRSGRVSVINNLFKLNRGTLTRMAREERKFTALERRIKEDFERHSNRATPTEGRTR